MRQKLPRDSGESIFAASHLDVSHGPLGRQDVIMASAKLNSLWDQDISYSRHSPERSWGHKIFMSWAEVRAKNWANFQAKFSGHFRAPSAVLNDLPN